MGEWEFPQQYNITAVEYVSISIFNFHFQFPSPISISMCLCVVVSMCSVMPRMSLKGCYGNSAMRRL